MCNYVFINLSIIAFDNLNIEKIIGISTLFYRKWDTHYWKEHTSLKFLFWVTKLMMKGEDLGVRRETLLCLLGFSCAHAVEEWYSDSFTFLMMIPFLLSNTSSITLYYMCFPGTPREHTLVKGQGQDEIWKLWYKNQNNFYRKQMLFLTWINYHFFKKITRGQIELLYKFQGKIFNLGKCGLRWVLIQYYNKIQNLTKKIYKVLNIMKLCI